MHEYTSSGLTEESAHYKAILELGKKLTSELDLDQTVDTLGRWMAHYISELILDVEKARAEEKAEKMRVCSEAILNLWEHRYIYKTNRRPLAEFEPILTVLANLAPENDTLRYFSPIRSIVEYEYESDKVKYWLDIIEDLEYSAKILIRYCIVQAAQEAHDESREWISLVEAIGPFGGNEIPLIHALCEDESCSDTFLSRKAKDKITVDKITRLKNTIKISKKMIASLEGSRKIAPRQKKQVPSHCDMP